MNWLIKLWGLANTKFIGQAHSLETEVGVDAAVFKLTSSSMENLLLLRPPMDWISHPYFPY